MTQAFAFETTQLEPTQKREGLNDILAVDMPQLAFGGEKNSGLGRFGSRDVANEFTTQHWVSSQHTKARYPF